MAVVSDTSPLCYLLLIDLIDLLPELYDQVIIPQAVLHELSVPQAPEAVQAWIAQPPVWLEVLSCSAFKMHNLMVRSRDWGLGTRDWDIHTLQFFPIPNPQPPIPEAQI
jgi:predicted nucleic acid-binding protein